MSDSSTPTPIEMPQPLQSGAEDVSFPATLTPAVLEEIQNAFAKPGPTKEEVSGLRKVFEADQEEAAMEALKNSDPAEYIRQLGAMAVVRNKTEGAKFATKVESRTYEQVADGVVSREGIHPKTVPERKPKIDLLDPRTRLGRLVSMVFFGEKAPKSKVVKHKEEALSQERITEMSGGPLSARALQKYRDDN